MSNERQWPIIAAHSMTIGGKHTFRDWSLVPTEILSFSTPTPDLRYQEVPGASGSLDTTDVLTGSVSYRDLTGSLNFIALPDKSWPIARSDVLNYMQGKRLACVLDDDPEHFYIGRFWVSKWMPRPGYSEVVIDYNIEPYKWSLDTTASHDWMWNDLFDVTIYYGEFTVNGIKTRTFINPSDTELTPKFTCSAPMIVEVNGIPGYVLMTGETTLPGFTLQPGENTLVFSGTGNVLADYSMGKML